jgi:purine nucleosidase
VLVHEVTRHLFDVRGVDAMALHDPLAIGVAIQPDLVTTVERDIAVETHGKHTLGQTVVDLRPSAPHPRLATYVCTDVDSARFKALFFETLRL